MPRVSLGQPDNRNISPLTITLRVKLQPGGPPPAKKTVKVNVRNQDIVLDRMSTGEFESFKQQFQRVVTEQWSGKISIAIPTEPAPVGLSPDQYRRFFYPGLVRWRPCVQCRLAIEFREQDYDWWVVVVKPARGQPEFPSFMFPREKHDLAAAEGLPHGMLALGDIGVSTSRAVVKEHAKDNWNEARPVEFKQLVAGHEVGHMLGLKHVNYSHPICHERPDELWDGNDTICYGDTIYKASDAMGHGSEVRAVHGKPWLNALKHITGHRAGWRVTTDPLSLGCATPETPIEKIVATGKELVRQGMSELRQSLASRW